MSTDVVCMALANVPQGTYTVRIISLDPNDCLTPLSMQALPDSPEYLRHLSNKQRLYTYFDNYSIRNVAIWILIPSDSYYFKSCVKWQDQFITYILGKYETLEST